MAVMFVFLGIFLVVVVYKIYQFITSDADLNLLKHSLRSDFFKDKVVWVTGASSGIGEELCRQMSPLGAKIILSARSKDKLESVCQNLACPENGKVLLLDMTDRDRIVQTVNQAKKLYGRIDILVNNAGICNKCDLLDFDEEPARMLFDVNFLNTVSLTKAVLKIMIGQKGGHIVNIASVSGKGGGTGRHYYGSSKAALLSMMDSIRIDFVDHNITVSNLLPGPVRTDVMINALTGTGNERYGKMDDIIGNGMDVKRCCSLILVAVSNKLNEAWISTHPFLLLTYLGQYMPWLQIRMMFRRKRNEDAKRKKERKTE